MEFAMFARARYLVGLGILMSLLAGTLAHAQRTGAGLATITITSPLGTSAHPQLADANGEFVITISVQNFTLDPRHIGSANRPGFGHYHIYVDTFDPSSVFKYYVNAAASPTVRVTADQLAKAGATSGTHVLYIVLANNDHSLVKPLALAETVIRIVPTVSAAIAITSGTGSVTNPLAQGSDGDFVFTVQPRHFTFDAAHLGSHVNRPGYGHYHVYVDRIDPNSPFNFWLQAGATTTVRVTPDQLAKAGVTSGTHVLYVALTHNDHSLLKPLVVTSTVIRLGPIMQVAEWTQSGPPMPIPARGKVTLHVQVKDLARGTGSDDAGGYFQVYVDFIDEADPSKNLVLTSSSTTLDVSAAALARVNAGSGIHTLYVVLANRDHSLFAPLTGASTLIAIGS
jgi:hypothetical protein